MKIARTGSKCGGVLVMTLIFCAVIGIMLTAYLSMLSNRQTLTLRSQVWNNCIPMCEAGVEEALAHLNHSLTSSNFAINGWVLSGGFYVKERSNFNGGSYLVRIETNYPPAITSQGRLLSPIGAAPISRSVRVQTKVNQQFPYALLAKTKIICSGNGGRVDSFNSTNVLESTNGQYSAALATDRAMVATISRTWGDISLNNVSIYGFVGTGPGGTVILGPNGNVGSKGFNNTAMYDGQIEDGHKINDVNVYIPDAHLPLSWGPWSVPNPGNIGGTFIPALGWVGGTNYTYLLKNDGDYQIGTINMSSGHKMMITAKVRIYVTGQTSLSSDAEIIIGPGGSVEWYAGNNVSMGGKGLVNNAGVAKNFSLVGLNTCVDITYSGSAQFIGTIYAPRAKVVITGSADAFGAIVANEINLQGMMSFHYDEALKADPGGPKFLAASWREL